MSTNIGDLIFDSGKTLFEILDSLDVANVSQQLDSANMRLDEVNDQLRQLSSIVDTNQANNNASFISVNTQLDDINIEVAALTVQLAPLVVEIDNLSAQVSQLANVVLPIDSRLSQIEDNITALQTQVSGLLALNAAIQNRLNALEVAIDNLQTSLSALTSRVLTLEVTKDQNQQLRLGNEYLCSYRVGNPGTTYYFRIVYSGSITTKILANVGYQATVLSSIDNSATNRSVYLCAPFDTFSVSGRYNYPMIQGPCQISFVVNNSSPIQGYITTL